MNSVSFMHSRVQTRLKQTLISSCSIISNQRCTTKHYLLWQFTMSLYSDHSGALAADCLRRAICCWFVTTSTKKNKNQFREVFWHSKSSCSLCEDLQSGRFLWSILGCYHLWCFNRNFTWQRFFLRNTTQLQSRWVAVLLIIYRHQQLLITTNPGTHAWSHHLWRTAAISYFQNCIQ